MTREIRELLKPVVFVKSVPDNNPDANGVWVPLGVSEDKLHPTNWEHLTSLLPDGFHAVAVRR